jgi:hypothetical protein
VAIAVSVAWPADGFRLRLLHHLFDVVAVLGMGAWLALALALVLHLGARIGRWAGWAIVAASCIAAMAALLGYQLRRQATVILDGALELLLFPLYLVLAGLAVPAAYLIGALSARLPRVERIAGLAIGIGGMIAGHVLMRDDHPDVHTAIAWVSACVAGAVLAPAVVARLSIRRRALAPALALGAAAIGCLAWSPSNAVRLEVFREPGAVAEWLLAQLVWSLPPVEPRSSGTLVGAVDPEIMRRAGLGMPDDPVVVLITIDALRADVLASGAYDRQLPQLALLRDHGAYFTRFSATGSQTSVSLTSMFSGRYFSELDWQPYGDGRSRFLYAREDDSPRFPELLSADGVHTVSYLGLLFLQGRFGIARGFVQEHVVTDTRRHAFAAELMKPLIAELDRIGDGRHFLYAHVMEPHEPYDRGSLKSGGEFERYVSEIAVVDGWLRKVVRVLRRRFPRRGYLLVSADHGEAFGEHGTYFHTKTLYEELIAVPLIAWGPGIDARRIEARAGLIDVGPTVLQLFGLDAPEGCSGRSLLPLMRGLVDDLPRPVLAEGRLRRAIYDGDIKVIEDGLRKTVEAYDLARDPDESRNLFDRDRARVESALAKLRAFFEERSLRREGYRTPYKP